jgi:hypothetical protein
MKIGAPRRRTTLLSAALGGAALAMSALAPFSAQAGAVTITSIALIHGSTPDCEDTVSGSACAPIGVTASGATTNPFLNNLATKEVVLGYGGYDLFGDAYAGTQFMIPGDSITVAIGLSDGTSLTATTLVPDLSVGGTTLFDFAGKGISIETTGITTADRMQFGNPPGAFTPDGVDDYVLELTYAPVPEPATWAILLIGLAAVGVALRTRRGAPALA